MAKMNDDDYEKIMKIHPWQVRCFVSDQNAVRAPLYYKNVALPVPSSISSFCMQIFLICNIKQKEKKVRGFPVNLVY